MCHCFLYEYEGFSDSGYPSNSLVSFFADSQQENQEIKEQAIPENYSNVSVMALTALSTVLFMITVKQCLKLKKNQIDEKAYYRLNGGELRESLL